MVDTRHIPGPIQQVHEQMIYQILTSIEQTLTEYTRVSSANGFVCLNTGYLESYSKRIRSIPSALLDTQAEQLQEALLKRLTALRSVARLSSYSDSIAGRISPTRWSRLYSSVVCLEKLSYRIYRLSKKVQFDSRLASQALLPQLRELRWYFHNLDDAIDDLGPATKLSASSLSKVSEILDSTYCLVHAIRLPEEAPARTWKQWTLRLLFFSPRDQIEPERQRCLSWIYSVDLRIQRLAKAVISQS